MTSDACKFGLPARRALIAMACAAWATSALAGGRAQDKPAYFDRVQHDFASATQALPSEAAAMLLLALKGKCTENTYLVAADKTSLEEVYLGAFGNKASHYADPAQRLIYLRGVLDGATRAGVIDKVSGLDLANFPLACTITSGEIGWMQRLTDHTPEDRRLYGHRVLDEIEQAEASVQRGPVPESRAPAVPISEDPKAWYAFYFPDVFKGAFNGFQSFVVVSKNYERTAQSGKANLMHELADARCGANGVYGLDERSTTLGYVEDMTEYQVSYRCGTSPRMTEDAKILELSQTLKANDAGLRSGMVAAGDFRAVLKFGRLQQAQAYELVRWAFHDGLAQASPGCKGHGAVVPTSFRFWLKPESKVEDAELQLHFGCGRVSTK